MRWCQTISLIFQVTDIQIQRFLKKLDRNGRKKVTPFIVMPSCIFWRFYRKGCGKSVLSVSFMVWPWLFTCVHIEHFQMRFQKGFVPLCEHPHLAPANSALQDRKLTPFSVNSHVLVLAISSLSHHCNYFNTLCTTIRCTAWTAKVVFFWFLAVFCSDLELVRLLLWEVANFLAKRRF